MVNITVNNTLQTFETFLIDDFPNLFAQTYVTEIENFFNLLNVGTLTPTAMGSTLIRLTDGNGYTIEMQGANFGPITDPSDLALSFDDFASAVQALNGSATANLSRLKLTGPSGDILILDTTATAWTVTTGTDTLTMSGNLPTSLAHIEAAYSELYDETNGGLNASYNPATSVLAGYDISSLVAASGGTTRASLTWTATGITITSGVYEAVLSGNLPETFAEIADIAVKIEQGATTTGYTIASMTITNTATSEVVAELTGGPVDLIELPNLLGGGTSGDDVFTSTWAGSFGFELDMGAGDDVVTLADGDASDEVDIFVGNAGHAEIYLGQGTGDRDVLNLWFKGAWPAPYTVNVVGTDLVFNINPAQSVTLVNQMTTGNVEWADTYEEPINLVRQEGTAGSDNVDFNGIWNGNFYDGLAGNDFIRGNWATDILLGGAGADTFYLSDGSDYVDGGTSSGDIDIVDYSGGWSPLRVNFATGTIVKGSGNVDNFVNIESIITGSHADDITGDGNDNVMDGGAENDIIRGNGGNDTIIGGDGDDLLLGGSGNDDIDGGANDDLVHGHSGNDVIDGGAGIDRLYGDFNADTLRGGTGDDILNGGEGRDTIHGDEGNDNVQGGGGVDFIYGGTGNDILSGNSGFDRIEGNDGDDILNGDFNADYLYGGNDNDTLNGGSGGDRLFGESGVDTINGDDGNDGIFGGSGNDILNGGADNDIIHGNAGHDTLRGDAGNDRLYGDFNIDTLYGGIGDDILNGGASIDYLYGEEGNDALQGGGGHDQLFGGADNDELYGNSGFDTLNGGAGNDDLYGNFNADTFVFEDGFGVDTIHDFDASSNAEKVDLSAVGGLTTTSYAAFSAAHLSQTGSDVLFDDLSGNTITMIGTALGNLDAGDFIL